MRSHPACRARRVPRRTADSRPSFDGDAERDAYLARRLPHAGSVDDAAAPRHRYRESDFLVIARRLAAIERDRGALDVAGPRAAQKQRQLGDILGLADAAQAALDQRLLANLFHRLVLRLGELRE